LQPLEFVIHLASHVLVGVSDDAHHVIRSVALVESKREALTQAPDRALALETGEAGAEHELHGRDELGRMWAERKEGCDAELLEERVSLGVAPAHQDDHLVVELERTRFELDSARPYVKEETEINVNDVAFPIDHDVTVVAVLDLEYVARYGVRCHRLDEVPPCLLI